MADRKETEARHKEFVEYVQGTQHFKLNSKAHIDGLFIETRQYRPKTGHWALNGYWSNPAIKVLVFGSEKIQFYFNKEKLLTWMNEHSERIGEYNGNVRGISLSVGESIKLADMVIK